MATMTRTTMVPIDASYAAAAIGQALPVIAAPANGDLIPISSGRGTLIIAQTTGTAATVIITNVVAPPYGTGGNVTMTLAATDIQAVLIANDGTDRFDPGVGQVNAGFCTLNYTTPTALKIYAVTIP